MAVTVKSTWTPDEDTQLYILADEMLQPWVIDADLPPTISDTFVSALVKYHPKSTNMKWIAQDGLEDSLDCQIHGWLKVFHA